MADVLPEFSARPLDNAAAACRLPLRLVAEMQERNEQAKAVKAADTRMSGVSRLWKKCSNRNEPTWSADAVARLVIDIITAKLNPSDRCGL